MRPLTKPPLPDHVFAAPASAVLLQTLGEYCSVTEEPIPAEHRAWHKHSGAEVLGPIEPSDLKNVLLLSENAFLSQLGKIPQGLLYPDDDLTFRLGQTSPFVYKLEQITLVKEAEGSGEPESSKPMMVIVKGTSPQARETIEYFKLNSDFFNESTQTLTIPKSVYSSGFDRRLEQRTEAWNAAAALANALRDISGDDQEDEDTRNALVQQARRVAAATGFWSTWASSLQTSGVDSALIRDIILPAQLPWDIGPGPHNPFPGTNPNCIP